MCLYIFLVNEKIIYFRKREKKKNLHLLDKSIVFIIKYNSCYVCLVILSEYSLQLCYYEITFSSFWWYVYVYIHTVIFYKSIRCGPGYCKIYIRKTEVKNFSYVYFSKFYDKSYMLISFVRIVRDLNFITVFSFLSLLGGI